LDQTDADGIENLAAWLTTVVARICLDMLRTRKSRREQSLTPAVDMVATRRSQAVPEPEDEAVMVESVGRALLVVMDRLTPAERVAYVLHDMFAVPFDEIGAVVGRSPVASKKLASRARARLRGVPEDEAVELEQHYQIVDAYLTASRGGDLSTLVQLLAPDVVRRADQFAVPPAIPADLRGARAVAEETRVFARRARAAAVALVDGAPGIIIAPGGRLVAAIRVTIANGRITEIDAIAEPARLERLPLAAGRV
jgi:DNA-directed RNA polymerase specialized sigma24 family protein